MRIDELKEHYKSWTALAYTLQQGVNAHQYWRKIGYIPFASQLLIEHKTGGLFKAREEDAKPLES